MHLYRTYRMNIPSILYMSQTHDIFTCMSNSRTERRQLRESILTLKSPHISTRLLSSQRQYRTFFHFIISHLVFFLMLGSFFIMSCVSSHHSWLFERLSLVLRTKNLYRLWYRGSMTKSIFAFSRKQSIMCKNQCSMKSFFFLHMCPAHNNPFLLILDFFWH